MTGQEKISGKKSVQSSGGGMPLGRRFFLFLAVLLITIFLGVTAILLLAGTLTAGLSESERFLENELNEISSDIAQQFGQVSMQTVNLAKNLSVSIEQKSASLGLSLSDLGQHPLLLEEIISGEYEQALFSLLVSKSSGVFFILDATSNPGLACASSFRSGLYIKNMEPNIISASSPNITVLRGFPGIARKKFLPLHAQWNMEFDVGDAPYYYRPMEEAEANPQLPLSRLYYWSDAFKMPGTSEKIMLCAAPLIDSNGHIFGVCGLEISAMLFKLSHMPDNNAYKRLFCLLTPASDSTIEPHRSLFAGGYLAREASGKKEEIHILAGEYGFSTYYRDAGSCFLGLHGPVQLYPHDSVFSEPGWSVALMMPKDDLAAPITRLNVIIFSSLVFLAIAGAALSFGLGNRLFVKPISRGLDAARLPDPGSAPKTRIPEIDNLIEHLARRNEELAEKARRENLSLQILEDFLERTAGLTPAENEVFRLYGAGFTVQEIAARLHLSVNTIKTHSKHIYAKLGVGSREEIVLYLNLLKEAGRAQ